MVKMDSTGVFFTPEDRKRISKRLLMFLTDMDEWLRMAAVRSLGETGDLSSLQALEEIRKNDSYKSPKGVFVIREMAARSIEQIKKREIQAK
jgi:HEAT repeat protein